MVAGPLDCAGREVNPPPLMFRQLPGLQLFVDQLSAASVTPETIKLPVAVAPSPMAVVTVDVTVAVHCAVIVAV